MTQEQLNSEFLNVCLSLDWDIIVEKFEQIHVIDGTNRLQDNALHMACKKNDFKLVDLILPKIPNINAVNNAGNTALHIAASFENFEIVNLLLNNGIDIHIKNSIGDTAMHLAVSSPSLSSSHHPKLFQALIEHGANLYEQNIFHENCFDIAQRCGSFELIKEIQSFKEYFEINNLLQQSKSLSIKPKI